MMMAMRLAFVVLVALPSLEMGAAFVPNAIASPRFATTLGLSAEPEEVPATAGAAWSQL